MKKLSVILFPPSITKLYREGMVNLNQLSKSKEWENIFSGDTVNKIKQLNSFTPCLPDEVSERFSNIMGIGWIFNYTNPFVGYGDNSPNKLNLIQTLMEDGREIEHELISNSCHNFDISIDFVQLPDSSFIGFINELHPLDSLCDRHEILKSNMGKLIDDLFRIHNSHELVSEPIVKSYMILKSK